MCKIVIKKTRFLPLLLLLISIIALTGCGSDTADTGSDDTRSAPTEATDTLEKYTGTWSLAAAESEGVTMAGNFAELMEISDDGMIKINADGSGQMSLGDDPVSFTWEETADNTITLKAEKATDYTGETAEMRYKDEALFMDMEEDGKKATGIFTHNGTYAGARIISAKDAKPITSEEELLGKWSMTGMAIMGISVYGDADSLKEMNNGIDSSVTFEKDGVAVASSGDGSWKIDDDGATVTLSDITGEHTCPVKKLDDDIIIDMSELLGGTEFITLLSKQ